MFVTVVAVTILVGCGGGGGALQNQVGSTMLNVHLMDVVLPAQ